MTTPLQERHTRRVLGIHYCPTCKQDTMPEAKTGACFFCDTIIATPLGTAGSYTVLPLLCDWEHCRKEFAPTTPNRRFCSEKCKKDWNYYHGAEASREKTRQRGQEYRRRLRDEYKALTQQHGVRRDWHRWEQHLKELREEAA